LMRMAACGQSIFWFCGRAISLRSIRTAVGAISLRSIRAFAPGYRKRYAGRRFAPI
jgi:hypothetical protein